MDFINPVGDKKQIPREHWPLFAVPLPVVTLHPLVFRGEAVFQDLRVYHPLTGNACGILFSCHYLNCIPILHFASRPAVPAVYKLPRENRTSVFWRTASKSVLPQKGQAPPLHRINLHPVKHPPIWPISTPDAPCDNLSGYLAKKQNLSPLRPCYLLQSSLNTFNDRLILIISRVTTPLLYTTESQYVNINLNPCFSVLFLSYISNITFLFNLNLNIKNLKNN